MDDFAQLAKALEPVVAAAVRRELDGYGEARPRPDLHAEHDRRFTDHERRFSALEGRIERLVDAVEKLVTVETQRSAVIGHWKFIGSNWPSLAALGAVIFMVMKSGVVGVGL